MPKVLVPNDKPRLSPGTTCARKTLSLLGGGSEQRYRAFNANHGTFCLLNDTGWEILPLINGRHTIRDIARILADRHETGVSDVLHSITQFVDELRRHKLVFVKGDLPPTIIETNNIASPEEIWLNVTNKCNLRCITCFKNAGDAYEQEMPLPKILSLVDEMLDLNVKRVVVSGGEPFARKDILDILRCLSDSGARVLLISNGTLINSRIAKELAKIRPQIVQLSLDGSRPEINDRIRGAGSFEKTLRAARMLIDEGLDVRLYPTVTRLNVYDLPNMRKLISQLRPGFDHLSCAKFVAIGRGEKYKENLELTPEEFYEIFTRIPDAYSAQEIVDKLRAAEEFTDLTTFVPDRIAYGCRKVNCGIASGTFSIDPDGKVYPCQWLHLPEYEAGDLKHQTLEEIYFGSKVFAECRAIRVDTDIPTCRDCDFMFFCGGACRARALTKNGSLYGEDPECFYIKKFFENGFWAENQYRPEGERLTEIELEIRQRQQMA